MIAVESNVLDAVGCIELELSNAVDFIIHYIEAGDLIETAERVFLHNTKVRLLYAEIMHFG